MIHLWRKKGFLFLFMTQLMPVHISPFLMNHQRILRTRCHPKRTLMHLNDVPSKNDANDTTNPKVFIDPSSKRGLTKDEVQQKLEQYGKNVLDPPAQKTWIELWIAQFDDRLVQILLVVATISAISSFTEAIDSLESSDGSILHFFVEPFIILLILMINAAVGVWQQLSAINSINALKQMQPKIATVLRRDDNGVDNWIAQFDASQLVPGDVIKVKVGDSVPADAYVTDLLSSAMLTIDESALTGESESVSKEALNDRDDYESSTVVEQTSILFASTLITKGNAEAVVSKTGARSAIGKIQEGVMTAEIPQTPLNTKLDKFGDDLALLIAGICAAVWLISIPRFDDPSFKSVFDGGVYYTKVAVSLGVAAIPEGLPAVITLVLALGTRRLAEKNVIGMYFTFFHFSCLLPEVIFKLRYFFLQNSEKLAVCRNTWMCQYHSNR
jgi:magnesium-transporting ATPase (P-type)